MNMTANLDPEQLERISNPTIKTKNIPFVMNSTRH